ncbi:Hsp70 family protein [Micromonospora polyrhachis]|uniref:Actin-like ATPase involved in cell morphogenesis n=1 Tax=Micromonospora polyrhachis TaxID=1282883 RepID=A0A7W7SVN4_9ACTN|nr:Hsp70 family protein [Micromonospora polyrhachis]MBB4961798.1 actin-like ATPase involved in cell morphogenesis [Micromonospora polyrhachis]
MANPARLAVDLGTTHTVAVVHRVDQQPRSLLFDGSPLLASGVFVDVVGTVHTGRDATRLGAAEPERFEPHPKRRIDEGWVLLGEAELAVTALLAAVLRRVVEEARHAGVEPATDGTILTCPADWGQPRREVLREAARLAGLGQVQLVDEPIAAATYCVQVLGQQVPVGGHLGIFDLGGGTLDVAVVRREAVGLRVLATGGLDDLGGLDIDEALVAHLGQLAGIRDADLWQRLREPQTAADRRDRQSFWTEVRSAKEMLSRTTVAPAHIPGLDEPMHLTREELDRIASPLVARGVDEIRRVLQRAGVAPGSLAGLLLVGGASRMPLVATRLHARLGVAPSVPEQPELPVAYGALVYATAAGTADVRDPAIAGTPSPSPANPSSPPPPAPPPSPPAPPAPPPPPSPSPSPSPSSPVSPAGATFAPAPPMSPAPAPAGTPAATPPPVSPGWSPGFGPPPGGPAFPPIKTIAPPRRPVRRAVTVVVLLAVLAGCVGAVVKGGQWVTDALGEGSTGSGTGGSGGLGIGGDAKGGGQRSGQGKLDQITEITSSQAGATTTTIADGHVVTAYAGNGITQVMSQLAGGGQAPRWTTNVRMEPTEVRLTPVADLIIVDGERSVTHDSRDIRAVLSAADGKVLWQKPWEDRVDIAYYGTDVVTEVRDGIYDNAAERVDLRTGKRKWHRPGNDDLLTPGEHRLAAMRILPSADTPAGPGLLPTAKSGIRETMTASDTMVELNTDKQVGYAFDARTNARLGTGKLPLEAAVWVGFDKLAIGKQHRSASGGRAVLAAYAVPHFKPAWSLPLTAGFDIEDVAVCGPRLVCAAIDTPQDDGDYTVAVDIDTGKESWRVKVDWSDQETWQVNGGVLLFGEGPFDSIRDPKVLDFTGKELRSFANSPSIVATAAGRMVLANYDGRNSQWQVWVLEAATGKATGAANVGADLPEAVYLDGDFVTVTTKDRRTLVLKIGSLA